jgi:hypothetical protein
MSALFDLFFRLSHRAFTDSEIDAASWLSATIRQFSRQNKRLTSDLGKTSQLTAE